MLGIILSISVALLKALSEFAGKVFMTPGKENTLDEYSLAIGVRSIVIVPVFFLCLYQGFTYDISTSLGVLMLGSLGNALTTVTALKALKYGDISTVGPLGSITIPLLLLSSYFITKELPNTWGFFGVFLIFIGTYFLGVTQSHGGIFSPFRNILSNTGARYMLFTAFIWSLTAPLDKLGIQSLGVFHWLLYLNIFTSLFLVVYMLLARKKIDMQNIYSLKNSKKVGSVALVLGLGNVLQLVALKYTLVVYVVAIKRASGVFSVILGFLFFKEKNILYKMTASILMLIGVACIILGGNI